MKQFTKDTVREVRADVEKALKQIADDYGIKLQTSGTLRFSPDSFSVKIEGFIKSESSTNNVVITKEVETAAKMHGLRLEAAGKRLVDYKQRNHKYPFIFEEGGKRFKCSLQQAKAYFS